MRSQLLKVSAIVLASALVAPLTFAQEEADAEADAEGHRGDRPVKAVEGGVEECCVFVLCCRSKTFLFHGLSGTLLGGVDIGHEQRARLAPLSRAVSDLRR